MFDNKSFALLSGMQSFFLAKSGYRYISNLELTKTEIKYENIEKSLNINVVDETIKSVSFGDLSKHTINIDANLKGITLNIPNTINFNNYNFDNANCTILIYDKTKKTIRKQINLDSISFFVEDYKDPVIGKPDADDTVGDISGFNLTSQKNSFVELSVGFGDLKIVGVLNLPQGLYYEDGYIKGTPLKSGYFEVIFKLSDETERKNNILIPALPRLL